MDTLTSSARDMVTSNCYENIAYSTANGSNDGSTLSRQDSFSSEFSNIYNNTVGTKKADILEQHSTQTMQDSFSSEFSNIYNTVGTKKADISEQHSTQTMQDSFSSEFSNIYNNTIGTNKADISDRQSDGGSTGDNSSIIALTGGNQLLEESRTEIIQRAAPVGRDISEIFPQNATPSTVPSRQAAVMSTMVTSLSNGTGTAKARAARSPFTSPPLESIPVEEITIPADANVSAFTCDQVANFLRCFNVEDRIISHLHRKQVDGKRFSRLKDSELENLGMKNPALIYFRDKSNVKTAKKKNHFIL